MSLQIAHIKMNNPVVLAPMAGVCNPAFRLIAKEFGAGLVCAEMVSDKAIVHGNKRTHSMLFVDEREKPLSLQIFGADTETLVAAAKVVDQQTNADIIDINMGCPVPKITNCAAGAKWLLSPERIYDMVREVTQAVEKPLTVKMRIGWDSQHIYAVENAQAIEAGGAAAVAVHGRTRVQMYEGKADWDIIQQVKEAVHIPVIGNGDIDSPEKAKYLMDKTGVDGVMIGRAALGNPWMLYRTIKYLEDGTLVPEPNAPEKMDICVLHLDRLIDLKGEKIAVMEMRKHASWYIKGLPGSARVREDINKAETRDALANILYDFVAKAPLAKESLLTG